MLPFGPRSTSDTDLGRAHPQRKSMVMSCSRTDIGHIPSAEGEPKNETPKAPSDSLHRTDDPSSSTQPAWLCLEQYDNNGIHGLGFSSFEHILYPTVGGEPSPSLPTSSTSLLGNPLGSAIASQTAKELSLSDKFNLVCKFEDVLYIVQRVNSLRRALYRLPRGEYNDSLDKSMRQRIVNLKNQAGQLLDRYGCTPTFRTLIARFPEVKTYVRACGPFGPSSSYRQPQKRDRANYGIKKSTSQGLLWRNFKMTQEVRQLMMDWARASPQGAARHADVKAEPKA